MRSDYKSERTEIPMSIEVFKELNAVITANGLLNALHQSIPLNYENE